MNNKMPLPYELRLTNQTNLLGSENGAVEGIEVLESTANGPTLCVRQGVDVIGYTQNSSTHSWERRWRENVFGERGRYSVANYPWLITDLLGTGDGVILIRNQHGIKFYRPDKTNSCLELLAKDDRFHDVYGWHSTDTTMLWGRFYPDLSRLGLMTRDMKGTVKFYAVMGDKVLVNDPFPLWDINRDLNLSKVWTSPGTEFYLANVKRNGKASFVLRSETGLKFYEFNTSYAVEEYAATSHMARSLQSSKEERLFFADVTHQPFMDILQLHSGGLSLFRYDATCKDYALVHTVHEFSLARCWAPEYTASIQLFDVNSDGKDDLLFTGPRGVTALTMDPETYSWKTLFQNRSLPLDQRYALMIKGIPASQLNNNKTLVFLSNQSQLRCAEIVFCETPPMTTVNSNVTVFKDVSPLNPVGTVTPRVVKYSPQERTTLWLRQHLDCSSLLNAVDETTGKLGFELPLIDISNALGLPIRHRITYQGSNAASDLLGIGWSFPHDFIRVHHNDSIFPEDFQCVLVTQNVSHHLNLDSTRTNKQFQTWQFPDQPDIDVKYYPDAESWEVTTPDGKQTYGRKGTDEAIEWTLATENWCGKGSDASHLTPLARAWYLVEQQDHHGSLISYRYDTVSSSVSHGKSFTGAVYLTSIDNQQGNKVEFDYAEKSDNKYEMLSTFDDQGSIEAGSVKTRYLQGYRLQTLENVQHVTFCYQTISGERCLTAIEQQGDSIAQPVLEFRYSTEAGTIVLEKVVLPNGNSLKFDYEVMRSNPLSVHSRYTVSAQAQIVYGPFYAVLSDIRSRQVALRVLNQDATEVSYSEECTRLPMLGKLPVIGYEVFPSNDFIGVVLRDERGQELCLFRWQNGVVLSTPQYYELHKDAHVQFSHDFLIITEKTQQSLERVQWNVRSQKWDKSSVKVKNPAELVMTFGHGFVVYDDQALWINYRDNGNNWQSKELKTVPGLLGTLRQTVHRFDIGKNNQKQLLDGFERDMLQMKGNVVMLRTCRAKGAKLYLDIMLYLLNSEYDVIQEQMFTMEQDDLQTFSGSLTAQDGTEFTFGYNVLENGGFRLAVRGFSGPLHEEFEKTKSRLLQEIVEQENRLIKEIEGYPSMTREQKSAEVAAIKKLAQEEKTKLAVEVKKKRENLFDKAKEQVGFVMDFNKYRVVVDPTGVTIGNKRIVYTGSRWHETSIPDVESKPKQSLPLGKHFIVSQSHSTGTYKLYRQDSRGQAQGDALLDLEVKTLQGLRAMYPVYLAYQVENKPAKILSLINESTLGKVTALPAGEKLSGWCTGHAVVTITDSMELVFRPSFGSSKLASNSVVTRVSRKSNHAQRYSGYGYEPSSGRVVGNTIVYRDSWTVPAADKQVSGWIEIRSSQRKVFNAKKQEVEDLEPARGDKPERNNPRNMLWDRTKQLVIADTSPYLPEDEVVGYHGFEDYETTKIGDDSSKSEWKFDSRNVVRGGFAMTGGNYLRLNGTAEGGKLTGTFCPAARQKSYVVSAWVRSKNYAAGKAAYQFYATVYTSSNQKIQTLVGQVRTKANDWLCLEILIDLEKPVNQGKIPTQKVVVELMSEPECSLDVDHIRFSPKDHSFEAHSYDPLSGKLLSTLYEDGRVAKILYDDSHRDIARINHVGRPESVTTYSKLSWKPDGVVQAASKLSLTPKRGFYESFSPAQFGRHWQITSAEAWEVAPSRLLHHGKNLDRVALSDTSLTSDTMAVRLVYRLKSESSSLEILWQEEKLVLTLAYLRYATHQRGIPTGGELVLLIASQRLAVWVEGHLVLEAPRNTDSGSRSAWVGFAIAARAETEISSLLLMDEPSVTLTYLNGWGLTEQTIKLEDGNTVDVKHTLYDKLDRPAITTVPTRIKKQSHENLLNYYTDFVSNGDPYDPRSVWVTGILSGSVHSLNPGMAGYGYLRTQYADHPGSQVIAVGRPGREFSVDGIFTQRFSSKSGIAFLDNLFPPRQGFRQKVKRKPDGTSETTVLDLKKNQVALYARVPSGNHLLTTYEYDDDNNLVKQLPPLYHQQADTYSKSNSWAACNEVLSESEKELQRAWGVHLHYDQKRLQKKVTPDTGITEYMYTPGGLLRFEVHSDKSAKVDSVIYYEYNTSGEEIHKGLLKPSLNKNQLQKLLMNDNLLPEHKELQKIEHNPLLKSQIVTTKNKKMFSEEVELDTHAEVYRKRIHIPSLNSTIEVTIAFEAGQVSQITYPLDFNGNVLDLQYRYNLQGQMSSVGLPEKPNHYASFSYTPRGVLATENHRPTSSDTFTRSYEYNSAGFTTQLRDRFLTEDVEYTSGSYDGFGHADGTVARTTFKADWHDACDKQWLSLTTESFVNDDTTRSQSAQCFQALKDSGYIDAKNHCAKTYYPALESRLPIVFNCGSRARHISNVLVEKGFPKVYGHAYAYGSHQELTKAKYFVGEAEMRDGPLQTDSFAKGIPGVSEDVSKEIWNKLRASRHLIEDNETGSSERKLGKAGTSIFRSELLEDLKYLNDDYLIYVRPLEKLLSTSIGERQNLSWEVFQTMLLKCHKTSETQYNLESKQRIAEEIWRMLEDKCYVGSQSSGNLLALDKSFRQCLQNYSEFIPDIVNVLSQHFGRALGESPGDVESYDIDANGNHCKYYTGFDRYVLQYTNRTNQIHTVVRQSFASSQGEVSFAMEHDSHGNVVKALHKGIQKIEYDAASQRTESILMTDGRSLWFGYDTRGERVWKRVRNADGKITHEKYYLRDNTGRCLVDAVVTMAPDCPSMAPSVCLTAYVYGPNGLVGFVRRGRYYSVIADHEGSIRLVVRDGEVVAAYDYLPYGHLSRRYGRDPDSHVAYRYTGQELDRETGLYNYHARLYDPVIGRFYGVDPREQYASPYKYAGNSPVSLVDPDGEFAFILAGLGAYLGAAAANKSFNPRAWDYTSGKTYMGLLGGGLMGYAAPALACESVEFLVSAGLSQGVAVGMVSVAAAGGAYMKTASLNKSWNPVKWDLKCPTTYNSMFEGGIFGLGVMKTLGGVQSAGTWAGLSRGATMGVASGLGCAGAYFNMATANESWNPREWNYTGPATYNALGQGFMFGVGFRGGIKTVKKGYDAMTSDSRKLLWFGTVATLTYKGGTWRSKKGDPTDWGWSNPKTPWGLLQDGLKQAKNMVIVFNSMDFSIGPLETPELSEFMF